jgi:hypothetical protein
MAVIRALCRLLLLSFSLCPGAVLGAELANARYSLRPLTGDAIELKAAGVPVQQLSAEFTVMYSERDPGFGMNRVGRFDRALPRPFPSLPAVAIRWAFYADDETAPARELDALGITGEIHIEVNSRGERMLEYEPRG